MGAKDDYNMSRVVIVGAPMDLTVSFRPGSRLGPTRIREVSHGLEDYSPHLEDSLQNKLFYDLGNLDLPFGNVEKSLELIRQTASQIFDDRKIPLFLGGEHLISLPIVSEALKKYPDLVVLHFDAHADLRDTYFEERLSHATVLRRIAEKIKPKHLYHFGIRSGTKEEFEYSKDNTCMNTLEVLAPFKEVLRALKGRDVYITLDIDVVDPAFAPGTGTPEPGGCTSKELFEVTSNFRQLNIIGFDLVEVSPPYDPSDVTSLLAAKILREFLIAIC